MTPRPCSSPWIVLGLAALLLASAANAGAQTEDAGRVFVNVNVGGTLGSKTDDTRFTFPLFGEDASVSLARSIGGSATPDLTGGLMLTRRIGVALNFSRFAQKKSGDVSAQLPDPAFYDTPHPVAGQVDDLVHEETWVAVLVAYPLVTRPGLDVTFLGGPAVARVTHELASDVGAPSISTVALTLEPRSRSLLGGQIGIDVRRMLSGRFGVGAYVRYNAARGNLGAYKANLGGVQVGGGARLRF